MWKKVWSALPYLILYVAAVAIIGLVNVIGIGNNVAFWQDAVWWNRTVSQNIANILVLTATIMLWLNRLREDDEDYLKLRKSVEHAVRNSLEADFGEWVFIKNKLIKTNKYISEVQKKIARKEKRARTKDLVVWYEGTEEQKKQNRYCRKRLRMEDSIRPERLEKRILSLKIDYDRIDRNFIETGESNGDVKENQKQDSLWRKVTDNIPRIFFGIGGAAFFNAFIYEVNEMDETFWFRFAFGFAVLIWMYINGRMYSFSYMARVLMVDLNTRFNIIKDYLTYKVGKTKEVKK